MQEKSGQISWRKNFHQNLKVYENFGKWLCWEQAGSIAPTAKKWKKAASLTQKCSDLKLINSSLVRLLGN